VGAPLWALPGRMITQNKEYRISSIGGTLGLPGIREKLEYSHKVDNGYLQAQGMNRIFYSHFGTLQFLHAMG
jgi:hypothetical protein